MNSTVEQWGLSPRDTRRAVAALQADEEVVLVAKPRASADPVMIFLCVGSALVVMCWLLFYAGDKADDWRVSLPLWGYAVVMLISPWWQRRRMRHTLYLLTNRRALVLEPGLLWGERTSSFSLHPNPVLKVERYEGGYGDIVLGYDMRWSFGHVFFRSRSGGLVGELFRRRRVSVGFLNVPQVDEVYALFAAQAAAVVPEGLPAVPAAASAPALAPAERRPIEFGEWGANSIDTTTPQALIGFGAVLSIFSLIALAVGIFLLLSDRKFDAACVKTQGGVVNVRHETEVSHSHSRSRGTGISIQVNESSTGSRTTTYYPTLSFTDVAGNTHYYESRDGSSEPGYYVIGQRLPLRYLPDEPTQVRMGEKSDFGMLFTIISGLALMVSGGLLFGGLAMRKK